MEGRCTCGHLRYRVEGRPLIVHACHCGWCQRETGSAHALNALWEMDAVILVEGHPEMIHTPSASGRGQVIARCPDCHVAVWSNYPQSGPAVRFVRVGTLAVPGAFPPDIHIYTSTKLPWVVLPDGAKAVEEFYDARTVWSAAARDRVRAVRARLKAEAVVPDSADPGS